MNNVRPLFFIPSFILTLTLFTASGQEHNLDESDTCVKFCDPGVKGTSPGKGLEIGIESLPNSTFKGPNGNTQSLEKNQRIYAKLRFPILLKPSIKILGVIRAAKQRFHFKNEETATVLPKNLRDKSLKSTGLALYGIKSLNEKNYMGVRASANFNGDYPSLLNNEGQNIKASLAALYGIKPSENLEYGIGLAQSYWNQEVSIFPVFRFNYTKADFGIEALLPKEVFFRYNLSKKSFLYAGAEYQGQEYLMNGQGNSPLLYDENALRFQGNFERRIVPWVWLNVKAGYQTSIDFSIQSSNGQGIIAGDQDGSIYGGIEISLRPPENND